MGQRIGTWTALLIVLVLTGPGALAQSPRPWDSATSGPGQADYDSRLDSTVKFWGAGLTLEEVFGEVARQTGVTLAFAPEDDQNPRVRVNLFLNEKGVTLRSLIAQLSWAVDRDFLLDERSGVKVYSLSYLPVQGEAVKAQLERALYGRQERWQEVAEKLGECQQALQLSREEAIEKYQGKDDLMLVNLLDPARRAALSFVTRRPVRTEPEMPRDMFAGLMGFGATVGSATLTDQDKEDLTAAFGLPESALKDPRMAFEIYMEAEGRLVLKTAVEYQPPPELKEKLHTSYRLLNATDDTALSKEEQYALDLALGESRRRGEQSGVHDPLGGGVSQAAGRAV